MLMHSVSIVVELANEAKTGRDDETGESDAKLGEGRPANEEPCESSGPTGEAPRNTDDDEEDEDDDDGECLSSDLARRVVIVDEADKIFRGRAQSAEPRVFEQRPDTPTLAGAHPRSESAQPLAPDQQQQLSRKTRHSLACPLAPALAPGGHTLGLGAGGGELAERGALIKLGMRRNTHHHVNFNPAALVMAQPPAGPSALAPASGASAQQTHPSSKSGAGGAPTKCANQVDQQQQQPRQWSLASVGHSQGGAAGATHWPFAANQHHQHRRQSLQIGRLTGACQSSRSLTEDELRGEREFNEQVRSAKSPEGFHLSSAFSANVYTNSLASRPELATRSAANLSRQQSDNQQRCQWTSGGELSSSPATDKYLATSKAGQQERAGSRGSSGGAGAPLPILHGQRRVSFSSIDPIVNRPPVAQHHQHQGQAQQRASICGTLCDQSAPAADHQVSKPQSQQEHERPGQLAERRHQDRTTTPDRGSLAQKRHSLASGAAESGAQVLGTENGHSGGAEGETRAPDGARGPARLAKEWAGAQTVHGRRTSGNWLGAGPTLVTSAAAGAQNNQVERKMSASGANSATPQTMKTSGEPTPAHRLGPAGELGPPSDGLPGARVSLGGGGGRARDAARTGARARAWRGAAHFG